jgi:hypothetical protein
LVVEESSQVSPRERALPWGSQSGCRTYAKLAASHPLLELAAGLPKPEASCTADMGSSPRTLVAALASYRIEASMSIVSPSAA